MYSCVTGNLDYKALFATYVCVVGLSPSKVGNLPVSPRRAIYFEVPGVVPSICVMSLRKPFPVSIAVVLQIVKYLEIPFLQYPGTECCPKVPQERIFRAKQRP